MQRLVKVINTHTHAEWRINYVLRRRLNNRTNLEDRLLSSCVKQKMWWWNAGCCFDESCIRLAANSPSYDFTRNIIFVHVQLSLEKKRFFRFEYCFRYITNSASFLLAWSELLPKYFAIVIRGQPFCPVV